MGKAPLRPARTSQFKRDYKRCRRRGYELEELHTVMLRLIAQETLEENYFDHELSGAWKSHRDCHIRPAWILIHRIADDTITFERTGTHSDLFK